MNLKNLQRRSIARSAALVVALLLLCHAPLAAYAAADALKPADQTYENGDIVLHKQAERVGPDEWEVTVSADILAEEIHTQPIEMVILLSLSGSMAWCTEPTHGEGNHVHSSTCALNPDCGKQSHTASCYGSLCENTATYCNTWHKNSCITGPDGN